MDLAGELVIVRNQAISSVDADDGRFRPMFLQLHSVVRDLQEVVMRTRMQPIASLFRRFPRLVRDLARQLDKEIELTLVGEEVELDRSVLEALADPLVHLVRNSVDHGIETPARRIEAGKPPVGNIRLSARPESGRIHVEIADDGAGVNPEAIRKKAAALGLKSASELERMPIEELVELILLPGFSTARAVTDVSGRGVGMDVVKTNLEQLGGRLEIHSTPGAGMRVELELPLTLAIVPCLLVSSGGRRYAIPQKDVEEVVCLHPDLNAGKIELGVDQEVYRLRGKLLPLVRLREVLARPGRFDAKVRSEILRGAAQNSSPSAMTTFVVARHGARRFGLIVDGVLGSEEVVLKPMQSFLKPLTCFAGATVMGDGNVVLVLDAAGVARHAGLTAGATDSAEPVRRRQSDYETQPFLLFVYGPDEQFAVPLQDVRRLDRVAAEKIERIGGEEFVVLDDKPVRLLRLEERLPISRPTEPPKELFVVIPRRSKSPIGLAATRILDAEQMVPRLDSTGDHGRGVLGAAMIRDRLTYVLAMHELIDQPESPAPGGANVLVVDDSEFFRRLVSSYLRDAGFTVETAVNGADGLEKLRAGRYELAVSDVEMPVLDGYGFARGVRAEPRFAALPLLALTSLSSDADKTRAIASGFSRHQVKLDRDRLLRDVEELLGRSEGGAA
jgi:two-component system chemotaxis sensor kinase CheA